MERHVTIKEAAKRVGLPPKTIRYYEDVGVIPRLKRNRSAPGANGYRVFGEQDIHRLQFVKRARRLGLPLAQVKELLVATERGSGAPRLLTLIEQRLSEIDQNIEELRSLRQALVDFRRRTEAAEEPVRSCCEPVCGPLTCEPEDESAPLVRIANTRHRDRR
ncbi:MAG: MerR family transcriptional regulator [Gemmatimonadetes bacterium]|nr:MerR family transcriptional regulator [Gemmatimonadota bacterium]